MKSLHGGDRAAAPFVEARSEGFSDAPPRRLDGPRWLAIMLAAASILAACSEDRAEPAQPLSLCLEVGTACADQRERRVETIIQACMEGQGFEYVAVDPAARRRALIGSTGVGSAEFEEQFGYGITTLYERRREQVAGEVNQKIRIALDESERKAYDRALSGDNLDATFDDAVSTGDFGRLGGCTKVAAETVFGGSDVLGSLQAGLEELEARVLADPRMVAAVAAWSGCMREEGYELAYPEEVDVILKRQLAAIIGSEPVGAADPTAPPTYDHAALEALQREEIKMVAADVSCEADHIEAVEEDVRQRYEREFQDQNVDVLSKVPTS